MTIAAMGDATALSGVRVLDLSRVVAGPLTCQILGDMGAEVIKIEHPKGGDPCRAYGPAFLKDREGRPTGESAVFLGVNRNKQSITADISKPEARLIVSELAAMADVLVENYKTGGLAKYGLDYATLSKVNPRLIYCSVTGFGQDGPYGHKPGYDNIFQAMGGLMDVTGLPDGVPGGGPMKVGPSIIDVVGGLYGAMAVLGALERRHRSGVGQHIDLSLLDCCVSILNHTAMQYLAGGIVQQRSGNEGFGSMPSQVLPCSDGPVYVIVVGEVQWSRLCDALGLGALKVDPRFASATLRSDNRAQLTPLLEAASRQRTTREFLDLMDKSDVSAGPVNSIPQVFADPQVRHRGMAVNVPHPLSDDLRLLANPIRYSESPVNNVSAPPLLGQDTDRVLGRLLGYDADRLAALRRAGAI